MALFHIQVPKNLFSVHTSNAVYITFVRNTILTSEKQKRNYIFPKSQCILMAIYGRSLIKMFFFTCYISIFVKQTLQLKMLCNMSPVMPLFLKKNRLIFDNCLVFLLIVSIPLKLLGRIYFG